MDKKKFFWKSCYNVAFHTSRLETQFKKRAKKLILTIFSRKLNASLFD